MASTNGEYLYAQNLAKNHNLLQKAMVNKMFDV
jgi:hypothetical protein